MPYIFLMLLIAALVGVVRPYKGMKRWHFAVGALAAFVGMGVTVPRPTPEELAARKAEKARKADEAAAAEAKEIADKAVEEARSQHQEIVAKAQPALELPSRYTKSEYPQTYARVGHTTFAKLNELEPGAAYAAAESRGCDKVNSAMVSDQSRPNKAVWFVDCANGNRFMIGQTQAAAALNRFKQAKLTKSDLDASCTLDSVALCKASPAQRAAEKHEVEFVSTCDMLLQQAVVSPSSLSMRGMWDTEFGDGDTIIYRRAFDSQNGFGAMIRSQYRCDVNAATGNISRFEVQGPAGTQRLI